LKVLVLIPKVHAQASLPVSQKDDQLRELSQKLEATFLSEMLKSAGFGKSRDSMGGGIGEEQFSSFMIQKHADAMAQAGGIGLAEHLFNSLKGR